MATPEPQPKPVKPVKPIQRRQLQGREDTPDEQLDRRTQQILCRRKSRYS